MTAKDRDELVKIANDVGLNPGLRNWLITRFKLAWPTVDWTTLENGKLLHSGSATGTEAGVW